MKISMYWADVYELMKSEGYTPRTDDKAYHKFTKRLEQMFNEEFPNQNIEIDWRD